MVKAPVTAAPTATTQPMPMTVTVVSPATDAVSSPTVLAAPSSMKQPSMTGPPTAERQSTRTPPPATGTATAEATVEPTTTEPPPIDKVTHLTDVLTSLPAFTLPEIGPSEATSYDPNGLLRMEVPFIPLDNPVPVSAAMATWLRPDDFVLGVERGGEARAYSNLSGRVPSHRE